MIEFILAGFSLIVGGLGNSIIGGGINTIVSGYGNMISGSYHSSILGGLQNNIHSSSGSLIGGGSGNRIYIDIDECAGDCYYASSDFSLIFGGNENTIFAKSNTGQEKVVHSLFSIILGGYHNTLLGSYHFLGGGYNNYIDGGTYNVLAGGSGNYLAGTYTVIGGGESNIVTGQTEYSVVPGGYANVVSGASYSFAGGIHAYALHNHSFVWNTTGVFATTKPGTFIINAYNGVGIQTNTIVDGVDLEINRVMRIQPRTERPFVCSEYYEGSIFFYSGATDGGTGMSYLCFCGRGDDESGYYRRRRFDDQTFQHSSYNICGNQLSPKPKE